MTLTVALPQGWSQFARQGVGEERLRAAVIRFLQGSLQLPSDPGEGPEVSQFHLPEEVRDYCGLNGHLPEVVVRRALAAFVLAAQKQAGSGQGPEGKKAQDDSSWNPAHAALFLKAVLFVFVGAGTWLMLRSPRAEGDLPKGAGEHPGADDDYSSWEPEP